MLKREEDTIKIYALGGLGEVGKNMYVVEVGSEIFILDAGIMSPKGEMLGVDGVIPDIKHIRQNHDKIKGIFLTHGHDDHIGAVPYILKQMDIPIYGTKLTLGILKQKLKEMKFKKKVLLIEVLPHSILNFSHASISFFKLTHNIPEAIGISVHTKQGVIVYTGDFKIDQTPIDNEPVDYGELAELGKKGVLCLLSDSTNANQPGFTPSENVVNDVLRDAFSNAKGRIIVASSTSNLSRIQQIFNAASEYNRKVVIVGKSGPILDTAIKLSYLKLNDGILIKPNQVNELEDQQLVLLVTGSQNSHLQELNRMASRRHKLLSLKTEDTVMMTDRPLPGYERAFSKTIDLVYRAKVNVYHGSKKLYVSGHASQEELKLLLHILKPKYLIPVQGEFSSQKAHSVLATSIGVPEENVYLLNNGDVIEFNGETGKRITSIPTGDVLIDGIGIGDVGNIVLRDRKLLSKDGTIIVVVTLSKESFSISSGPEIISRGFVYVRESESLLNDSTELVKELVTKCLNENINDWSTIKTDIRDGLSRFLYEKTKRRPMILPVIMEV